MEFSEVIATQKLELGAVAPVNENEKAAVAVLTDSDIPAGMPRTNRLDKLTTDQAVWVIRNGDAWLVYLKANDGEVVEYTGASAVEVTPAEVFMAICNTLENVWLALVAENETLEPEQIGDWCETLQCVQALVPKEYQRQGAVIKAELDNWQRLLPRHKG